MVIKSQSITSKEFLSESNPRRSNEDNLSVEVQKRIVRQSTDHPADEMFEKFADLKPSKSEVSREDVWTRLQQGTVR